MLLSATPDDATAGTQITLVGEHLCGVSANCATAGGELDLDLAQPVRAEIASYSDTQIVFTFGDLTPVGPTELVLTLDDTSSNALPFTVIACPPPFGSNAP